MRWAAYIFFLVFVVSCAETENKPVLAPLWTISGPFTSPESVIYDSKRGVVYVSNVAGYTANGSGYISTISPKGEVIEARWLDGINAPTGMAIDGDSLYVADFDRLVQIDIPSASIVEIYEVDIETPGMNDVSISPTGEVFVSASAISTVYHLDDGQLVVWAQSDELQFANGLFVDDHYLYVAGYFLRRIELETGEIEKFGNDEMMIDLESIESDNASGFFVSQIGSRPIMHVTMTGEISELIETDTFAADMDYVYEENILMAPSGGDSVSAYSVAWGTQ